MEAAHIHSLSNDVMGAAVKVLSMGSMIETFYEIKGEKQNSLLVAGTIASLQSECHMIEVVWSLINMASVFIGHG